jgi:hypothetical protein
VVSFCSERSSKDEGYLQIEDSIPLLRVPTDQRRSSCPCTPTLTARSSQAGFRVQVGTRLRFMFSLFMWAAQRQKRLLLDPY